MLKLYLLYEYFKRLKDKYHLFLDENYNIGFVDDFTPEKLLEEKRVRKITWMKHHYRDRFFADPFIIELTDRTIKLLVEELEFDEHKGKISLLEVDRKSKELKHRQVLLDIDTHLSYPAVITMEDHIYVCPENCESGRLAYYRFYDSPPRLMLESSIIDEALVDSTIIKHNNNYYLIATRSPDTQSDLYLYKSANPWGKYTSLGCVVEGFRARPAGDFFMVNGVLYRPSQNCVERYGASLDIVKVELKGDDYKETRVCTIYPNSFRYNLGLHTLNFKDSLCVVDGYGYLFPCLGRLRKIICNVIKRF